MMMRNYVVAGALLASALVSVGFAADKPAKMPPFVPPVLDYKTAEAGTYVLDANHVSVVWKVWHMGFSHFAGRFDKISGTATVDPANLAKSGVVITIDASSGDTGIAKLDEELDQKEYFDAEQFPNITFTSTKVEVNGKTADGKDAGKVYGMLSLKGVTKPIVLDAVFNGHGPTPMFGGERIGFEASGKIKRSEFGFNQGIPFVSDEVDLIIAAEFTKK